MDGRTAADGRADGRRMGGHADMGQRRGGRADGGQMGGRPEDTENGGGRADGRTGG